MPEPRKFSHKGKAYEIAVSRSDNGFSVRAYDRDSHGVGRIFSVAQEGEGKLESLKDDHAVAALMRLAEEEIRQERFRELKRPDRRTARRLRKSAYRVSYKSFSDQELELPDRFNHLDEAVEAAWVLLNAGLARMVDIPDPERNKEGGLRHNQIVDRGKTMGLIL